MKMAEKTKVELRVDKRTLERLEAILDDTLGTDDKESFKGGGRNAHEGYRKEFAALIEYESMAKLDVLNAPEDNLSVNFYYDPEILDNAVLARRLQKEFPRAYEEMTKYSKTA